MIEFDVEMVRTEAVKALCLVVAVRRLFKPLGLDTNCLKEMESDFREAAAEIQGLEAKMREDPEKGVAVRQKVG